MRKIYISKYAGILSAYGLSLADVVIEKQEPFSSKPMNTDTLSLISTRLAVLEAEGVLALKQQGFSLQLISCQRFINCRYSGTDTAIMIAVSPSSDTQECLASFKSTYMREYGFDLSGRDILVDDLRIRATASHALATEYAHEHARELSTLSPVEHVSVYFDGGRKSTPVYNYSQLRPGDVITGPALIIQSVATVVLEVFLLECIILSLS